MINKFVAIWKSENSTKEINEALVDLVVPICYAMSGKDSLSLATKWDFIFATRVLLHLPNATLAFGNWPYAFPNAEYDESRLKRDLTPSSFHGRVLEVTLRNSVDEAERIRDASLKIGFNPKCILIITGELHSRSARLIWQKVFPNARILITCINYRLEFEKGHVIRVQQALWKWLIVTLGRHLLLRTFGLSIRILRHRVAKI